VSVRLRLRNVVFEFDHCIADILGNSLDVIRGRGAHVRMTSANTSPGHHTTMRVTPLFLSARLGDESHP